MTKGFLLEDGDWTFFEQGDDVYRAPSCALLTVTGYQNGARFFCPVWQWRERQENGLYPFGHQELF